MRSSLLGCCLLLTPLLACVGVRSSARSDSDHGSRELRAAVVRSAQRLLGERRLTLGGRPLPSDCWSLPVAAYAHSGLSLGGGNAQGLYRAAADVGRLYRDHPPRPGDLVFTLARAETPPSTAKRDAPRAGVSPKPPDVHVGLVGEVDDDGTIVVYQRMARGVVSYRMNSAHPDTALAPGTRRPWNDRIAAGGGGTRLAGQLFSGYAAFLP